MMAVGNERVPRSLYEHPSSPAPVGKRKRSLSPMGQSSHRRPAPSQAPFLRQQQAQEHLQIDYLARRYAEDVPLVTGEEALPSILHLLDNYEGVLQRHESMAANLGAKPLGQTLMQRFERMFDGPVQIIQYPSGIGPAAEDAAYVGWLDVVEAFNSKPQEFTLVEAKTGGRVCHFWTKGCKVEVSEDDYLLVKSGIPQRVIPPQPIQEDEEKELGTLEIMEKRLMHVIALTDAVSGKARKLNLRLKARRSAIHGARSHTTHPFSNGGHTPSSEITNGINGSTSADSARSSQPSKIGFVAVNGGHDRSRVNGIDSYRPDRDGHSNRGVSASTREALLRRFSNVKDSSSTPSPSSIRSPSRLPSTSHTHSQTNGGASQETHHASTNGISSTTNRRSDPVSTLSRYSSSTSPAMAISSTPKSLLPPPANSQTTKRSVPLTPSNSSSSSDDGGPFKAQMIKRMESLNKGGRIEPPCDRCRRLGMECFKNLTACMGCTRKHAKCSWRNVRAWEVEEDDRRIAGEMSNEDAAVGVSPVGQESRESGHQMVNGNVNGTGTGQIRANGDGPQPRNGTVESPPLRTSSEASRSPMGRPDSEQQHAPSVPRMGNFPMSPSRAQGQDSGHPPSRSPGVGWGLQSRSPRDH